MNWVKWRTIQKMTIELVCHKNISCPQIESVIDAVSKKLGNDFKCKVTQMDDTVHVFLSAQPDKNIKKWFRRI